MRNGPRWQPWVVLVLLVVLVVTCFTIVNRVGATNDSVSATNDQGARRDCVTTLSAARNAVFQNMDIYKAIEIDQLAKALFDSQQGIKPTAQQVVSFGANEALLHDAIDESTRLQPAKTLDRLIDHGGIVDGVHYDACPS